jgi:hypothetical protein
MVKLLSDVKPLLKPYHSLSATDECCTKVCRLATKTSCDSTVLFSVGQNGRPISVQETRATKKWVPGTFAIWILLEAIVRGSILSHGIAALPHCYEGLIQCWQ